jgi:hypothetical protein
MEVFSSLFLHRRGFIFHSHSSLSTHMTGLGGPSWIHHPYSTIFVTKGFSTISNALNHLTPQISGQVPTVCSHPSLSLKGAEVFKVDGLHAMMLTEPHGLRGDLMGNLLI